MDMQDEWLHDLRSWAAANDSVSELWLFGSRAQGYSHPGSDVDLAIALMPPESKTQWSSFTNWCFDKSWKRQLEEIVGRRVSLEAIVPGAPGPDWDSMVRCFGVRLWSRVDSSFSPMPLLILKRASASRSSGEWNDDDFDVLADGVVVGRIFKANAAPVGSPWMWSLAFGHHEDRTPTHGYAESRTAEQRDELPPLHVRHGAPPPVQESTGNKRSAPSAYHTLNAPQSASARRQAEPRDTRFKRQRRSVFQYRHAGA
jgi:predicted nucleotidyltransferase